MAKKVNNKTLKKDAKDVDNLDLKEKEENNSDELIEKEDEDVFIKEDKESEKKDKKIVSSLNNVKKKEEMTINSDTKDIIKTESDVLDNPKEETEVQNIPSWAVWTSLVLSIVSTLAALALSIWLVFIGVTNKVEKESAITRKLVEKIYEHSKKGGDSLKDAVYADDLKVATADVENSKKTTP